MPELPEVETIVRNLRIGVIGKKIKNVEILLPRIVKSNNFRDVLLGNKFRSIKRIGKLIMITLEKGGYLLIHLKMTGQLVYKKNSKIIVGGHSEKKDDPRVMPNKWTRVIFLFNDNSKLYFNDLRTFGYLKIVNREELKEVCDKYGLEPFSKEFNLKNFQNIFKNRKTTVKALLLNQNLIAGLGNIYVDEILFSAGVLPYRRVNSLKPKEIKKIFEKIKSILIKAIKARGTTFNDYVDGSGKTGNFSRKLKVYGRTGKKCFKCGSMIEKTKTAGRGTHYCGKCQK